MTPDRAAPGPAICQATLDAGSYLLPNRPPHLSRSASRVCHLLRSHRLILKSTLIASISMRPARTLKPLLEKSHHGGRLMTWWAAALGFAGALAGSWGGQIIASRREDRRWQREREREDLRHEREMERTRQQHDREVDLAWRSERSAAYARLCTVLLAFEEKVYAPIKKPEVLHDSAEQAEVWRIASDLHEAYLQVMFGSSTAVDEAGRQVIRICKRITRWYESEESSAKNEKQDYADQRRAFGISFDGLIDACRHELNLGPQAPPPQAVARTDESAN
jgi:hypothetical protein